MPAGQRVRPLSGTDLSRQAISAAGELLSQEIHTTDQHRLFMENILIANIWQGLVADQPSMLALHSANSRGCWPMDICKRTDTNSGAGSFWLCISNNGGLLADWLEVSGGGGGGGSTNASDIFFASSSPKTLTVQNALDYLLSKIQALPVFGGAASLNVGTVAGTVAAGDDPRFANIVVDASNVTMSGLGDGGDASDLGSIVKFLISRIAGLGGASQLNVGTTPGTVAAGDDPRFAGAAGVGNVLYLFNNVH